MKLIRSHRRFITFCSILLIAGILRFYLLGLVPVGFHRDEAFLGYNAYSLLKTGRDMTGRFFPLHFESFLYSPGGYSYASIPFIFLYGLTSFSVRFASAFFGVLSVGIFYVLVLELFKKEKEKYFLAMLSSFLFAIIPWHINLSRTATENVVVLFFVLFGLWLYLKAREKSSLVLLGTSLVSFGITLAIYQSPRAFLPIFLPLLCRILPVKEAKHAIYLLLSGILFSLFSLSYIFS